MKGLRVERTFRGTICRTTDPKTAEEYRQAGALVIEDMVSDFYRYFSPILDKTAEYYWLIKGELLYQFPKEWLDNETYDQENDIRISPEMNELESNYLMKQEGEEPFVLTKPGFLGKYGHMLVEDWLEIIGFKKPPADVAGYCKEFGSITTCKDANAFLDATADICFFCIDGLSWELFAKDGSLLSIVSEHMKNKDGFRVIEMDLADKTI